MKFFLLLLLLHSVIIGIFFLAAEFLLQSAQDSVFEESYIQLPSTLSQYLNLSVQNLRIREIYLCFEKKIESFEDDTRVVITGTPGIGKSCFAFYLFIKAIHNHQPVALHIFGNTYVFFVKKLSLGKMLKIIFGSAKRKSFTSLIVEKMTFAKLILSFLQKLNCQGK